MMLMVLSFCFANFLLLLMLLLLLLLFLLYVATASAAFGLPAIAFAPTEHHHALVKAAELLLSMLLQLTVVLLEL
jgi:hypothetical protein